MLPITGSRRLKATIASIALLLCVPLPSSAFKIGFPPGTPPNHEAITAEAILDDMPGADPQMVHNITAGNYNTDLAHFLDSRFHFDNSMVRFGGGLGGSSNGGFEAGFALLHGDGVNPGTLQQAVSEATVCDSNNNCTVNPLFLHPLHTTYRDLVEDIAGTYLSLSVNLGCLEEPACPTDDFVAGAAYLQPQLAPTLVAGDFPDPDDVSWLSTALVPNFSNQVADIKQNVDALLGQHCRPWWSFSSLCFATLELMAPSDNDFQLLSAHLRILQYEYQAYFAWQHLGHAFHTTQDFFAHSNYVELASCRKGPPCDPGALQASNVCGTALSAPPVIPPGAIPLPTDHNPPLSLAQFQAAFNLDSLKLTLDQRPPVFGGDANSNHLQTGAFPCPPGQGVAGFPYCHDAWPVAGGPPMPGMNKDLTPQDAGLLAESNHQNFPWARTSAVRMSAALFGAFMVNLPSPGNFLNFNFADFVAAAVNPVGAMPACEPSLGSSSSGLSTITGGALVGAPRVSGPQRIGAPPVKSLPVTINPSLPSLAAMVRPVVMRTLPPITRPELLRPITQPHIFVRVSPNQVFRIGEPTTIVVSAFDAQNGAPLAGIPVAIGSVRGITAAPIPVAVQPQAQRLCGTYGGQPFCLNQWVSPSGAVLAPADRYPGGGGQFTLSVAIPKMLVSLAAGPAIKPGTATFTVVAVDAQTRQPIAGARVLVGGKAIGAANQPIAFPLSATAPFRPSSRAGIETLAAAHGPPLIVQAPGYSDALVHYAISSAAP